MAFGVPSCDVSEVGWMTRRGCRAPICREKRPFPGHCPRTVMAYPCARWKLAEIGPVVVLFASNASPMHAES